MPVWRYLANWGLTNIMDFALGTNHTEYHSGYRGYSKRILNRVKLHSLANDFIFDNEMLVAALKEGGRTCEVTCPTSYEEDASSIPFKRAVRYGFECLRVSIGHFVWRIVSKLNGSR
jgi:hypothetical protein